MLAGEEDFDIAIVSLDLEGVDGLRVCSQFALGRAHPLSMAVLMLDRGAEMTAAPRPCVVWKSA